MVWWVVTLGRVRGVCEEGIGEESDGLDVCTGRQGEVYRRRQTVKSEDEEVTISQLD